jgi:hypothetical protein
MRHRCRKAEQMDDDESIEEMLRWANREQQRFIAKDNERCCAREFESGEVLEILTDELYGSATLPAHFDHREAAERMMVMFRFIDDVAHDRVRSSEERWVANLALEAFLARISSVVSGAATQTLLRYAEEDR